ncbi:hypothetical protein [Cellulosimicrobium sp. Marseille-Q4280]|uniref:hypothetical protein n=1 Tax=Cellulosimicrobium sp. Marseille-Q4280 TaxID=2937992 RepID=UPI002041793B|nr:hypothetical protein [Cellulosimicrobium sp. Marseille-Q4280]
MSDTARLTAALRAEGLLSVDESRLNMTVDVDVAHLARVLRRHGLLTDAPTPAQQAAAMMAAGPANRMGDAAGRARAALGVRRPELHVTSRSGSGHGLSLHSRGGQVRALVSVDRPQDYELEDDELGFSLGTAPMATLRQGLLHGFDTITAPARGEADKFVLQLRPDGGATAQVHLNSGNALYLELDGNAIARLLVWLVTGEVFATNEVAAQVAPALDGVDVPAGRVRDLLRAVRTVPGTFQVSHADAYFDRVARHAAAIGTYAIGNLAGTLVLANPGETLTDVTARWRRTVDRKGGAS